MRPYYRKKNTMKHNMQSAVKIAAGVAFAAASVHSIIRARKNEKIVSEFNEAVDAYSNAVKDLRSPEMIAFDQAQTILTDRMLAGYYDDKSDADYQRDYDVLYANFLKK